MTLSLNQFPWTNLLSKYAFFTKPHGSPRLPLRTLWSVKDDGDEKRARPPLFFRVGVAVPHRLLAGPPAKQPKQKLPQFSLAGAPPLSGTFPTFRGGGYPQCCRESGISFPVFCIFLRIFSGIYLRTYNIDIPCRIYLGVFFECFF